MMAYLQFIDCKKIIIVILLLYEKSNGIYKVNRAKASENALSTLKDYLK